MKIFRKYQPKDRIQGSRLAWNLHQTRKVKRHLLLILFIASGCGGNSPIIPSTASSTSVVPTPSTSTTIVNQQNTNTSNCQAIAPSLTLDCGNSTQVGEVLGCAVQITNNDVGASCIARTLTISFSKTFAGQRDLAPLEGIGFDNYSTFNVSGDGQAATITLGAGMSKFLSYDIYTVAFYCPAEDRMITAEILSDLELPAIATATTTTNIPSQTALVFDNDVVAIQTSSGILSVGSCTFLYLDYKNGAGASIDGTAYTFGMPISFPIGAELSTSGSAQFYSDSNCTTSTSLGLANGNSMTVYIKDNVAENIQLNAIPTDMNFYPDITPAFAQFTVQ